MRIQQDLGIVGGASFGRYPKISIENTYNMIVADNALVPYPGYRSVLNVQSSEGAREIFRSISFDHMIIVIENDVFAISTALGKFKIGELVSEEGAVYITENGIDKIVFVDGTENIYIYDTVHGFSIIPNTIATFGFRPIYITFQDGYFIVADGDSNEWRLSAPNDPTQWPTDGSGTGKLQTRGDRPQAVVEFKRQLFVMGTAVSEIWHDVGNTLFPYQRDNSTAVNYGVLSAQTIACEFDLLVWLGQNKNAGPVILVSTGGAPETLATDGIEYLLDSLQDASDSSAFLFQENGHTFYQITFNTDNISLTYDFKTKLFFTLTNYNYDYHIAKRATFFNNKNYFVSYVDGKLYQFGNEFTDYDGHAIPRVRITKPFRRPDGSMFQINNIQLTLEQGLSTQIQKVYLSLSKDGGESFGNILTKELNNFGNRRNRLRFFNLGMANDVSVKFVFLAHNPKRPPVSPSVEINMPTDTKRFVIINAVLEAMQ